jgi:hypothetical protein
MPAGRQRCPWHTPEVIPMTEFYRMIFEGKNTFLKKTRVFLETIFKKTFGK